MTKISFHFTLCTMLLSICSPAWTQQPKKVPHIGYLTSTDPATESIRFEPFRAALRELGYIEGQNIAIEYRYAEGKADRFSALVAELVRLRVDIILVGGDRPIRAAKNATKTIPIIMTGSGLDPVKEGHVESLARPGGNVTGITSLNRELAGKRLELFKEAVPKLARVAVLYDPTIQGITRELKEDVTVAARALGLTVQPWEVRETDDFEKVFAALNRQRPHGLLEHGGGPLMRANQRRIAGFALKSQLPSIYSQDEYVHAGGLMSYGNDISEQYRRIAYFIDRILKGAKPADLPVEQPTKFELVINLKTGKQIGLTIPPDLLARATKIIR
jgi:ABC-type uncharacterized transport system substrate-binding protein